MGRTEESYITIQQYVAAKHRDRWKGLSAGLRPAMDGQGLGEVETTNTILTHG